MYRGALVALGTPKELKVGAIDGSLLLLESDRIGDAIETVHRIDGVHDAAVFGNALHLVVSGDEIADEVRRALESRGIEVTRLEPIRPSLEDAFVALTSGRAANHVAEASP
jgi:ABC-2 type transport system ATP-binding protein